MNDPSLPSPKRSLAFEPSGAFLWDAAPRYHMDHHKCVSSGLSAKTRVLVEAKPAKFSLMKKYEKIMFDLAKIGLWLGSLYSCLRASGCCKFKETKVFVGNGCIPEIEHLMGRGLARELASSG